MSLTCSSGAVTEDDNTATEVPADTADFTVTGFTGGATCTASETVPAGYSADESACLNVAITTGACTITNTLYTPTATPTNTPTQTQTPTAFGWGDLDCNGTENVRDGQWLLTSFLGSPISQTEPCPDLGVVP